MIASEAALGRMLAYGLACAGEGAEAEAGRIELVSRGFDGREWSAARRAKEKGARARSALARFLEHSRGRKWADVQARVDRPGQAADVCKAEK